MANSLTLSAPVRGISCPSHLFLMILRIKLGPFSVQFPLSHRWELCDLQGIAEISVWSCYAKSAKGHSSSVWSVLTDHDSPGSWAEKGNSQRLMLRSFNRRWQELNSGHSLIEPQHLPLLYPKRQLDNLWSRPSCFFKIYFKSRYSWF